MIWDCTFTWPPPGSPFASIPHWMPHWVSSSTGCKSKQLSLVSFTFHYRLKTSLELGGWFKTELSLSICQAGGKKMGAEITLVSKVPVELAPVPEKKLERPALPMWIHLRMYAPQRQAIHHYSLAGLWLLRRLQNVQDGHATPQQPGETNGTPLVDGMDRPSEEICFMESFSFPNRLMLQINEVLQQRSQACF